VVEITKETDLFGETKETNTCRLTIRNELEIDFVVLHYWLSASSIVAIDEPAGVTIDCLEYWPCTDVTCR
jgi:hypothetical protein